MKRYAMLVVFIVMALFIVGCDKKTDSDTTDKDKKNIGIVTSDDEKDIPKEINNEIVSVERFMEYYGVTETDIPLDYILDFIMEYRFREDTLAKKDYWATVSTEYENGVTYGTNTGRIFQGTPSELALEEYMKKAEVIVIEFDMYYGGELAYPGRMSLDLKNKKIYYATRLLSEYTDAEKCADLTDEEVQSIRDELPKHISENKNNEHEYNLDYTFVIKMKDPEYNVKIFSGNSGDELNYPGFDAYWKNLYEKKFGEEFDFEKNEKLYSRAYLLEGTAFEGDIPNSSELKWVFCQRWFRLNTGGDDNSPDGYFGFMIDFENHKYYLSKLYKKNEFPHDYRLGEEIDLTDEQMTQVYDWFDAAQIESWDKTQDPDHELWHMGMEYKDGTVVTYTITNDDGKAPLSVLKGNLWNLVDAGKR